MVQKDIIVFAVITGVICLGLFITAIILSDSLINYTATDQQTKIDLNTLGFNKDTLTYGLMCYSSMFEVYTGYDCATYLKANKKNNNINYFNADYNPNDIENFTDEQINNFCAFFKNPDICNVI